MNRRKKALAPCRSAGHNSFVTRHDLRPRRVDMPELRPLGREAHRHSARQVGKIAASLQRFGCVTPIVVANGRVVAGWAVVMAARQLGLSQIPAITVTDLSETELRALRLALNRIPQDATWDQKSLAQEITEILEASQDILVEHLGFETGELDHILSGDCGLAQEDDLPQTPDGTVVVSRKGDVWKLGEHRLLCGDARAPESYAHLLGADKAQMAFTDPPYNIGIKGNVSGLGKLKHSDFIMASGELSRTEFAASCKPRSASGGLFGQRRGHFVCCDWRHVAEMLTAGGQIYGQQLNLCVWKKSNAGMGALYRSRHELIFVYKVGKAAHINNIALGKYGRNRCNIWDYVSQSALNGTCKSKLSLHPTVKPVALVADAICDCSHRAGIILDPFGGAGDHHHRCRTNRAPRPSHRARSKVRGRQRRTLAAPDWRHRRPHRDGRAVRRHGLFQNGSGLTAMVERRRLRGKSGRADESGKSVDSDGNSGGGSRTRVSEPYEVGYGRPPLHSRFVPGQSGNPKGRRKGTRNLKSDVMRALAVPVRIRVGERMRTRSTQEALLMVLREKALRGNERALDRLLQLAGSHNNDELEAAAAQPLGEDDQAILAAYVAESTARPSNAPADKDPGDSSPSASS